MKKIIWIDTETTGLETSKHGLREVAFIIEIDDKVVEEGNFYINTFTYKNERYVSSYVRQRMSVDVLSLFEYPASEDQLTYFKNILESYIDLSDKRDAFVMMGFNVDFDYEFIKAWFEDIEEISTFSKYFGYKKIDVLQFVRNLKYMNLFETKNNQLETLCKHFGIEIDAHQALNDISATKELFKTLQDKFIIKIEEN